LVALPAVSIADSNSFDFPAVFFFCGVYTESLFLLLSVLAFYGARRRWWLLAIAAAALASATRMQGLMLVGVIALEWLAAQGWHLDAIHRAEAWRNLAVGIRRQGWLLPLIPLGALGLLVHMVYLNATFSDLFAFIGTAAYHNRGLEAGLLGGFAESRAAIAFLFVKWYFIA
jgi:Gpi18-like mannosyltransferase